MKQQLLQAQLDEIEGLCRRAEMCKFNRSWLIQVIRATYSKDYSKQEAKQ